jgi:hypothetical protein
MNLVFKEELKEFLVKMDGFNLDWFKRIGFQCLKKRTI